MQTTNLTHLKAHLSEHLKKVKKGGEIVITEHERAIAKIVPFETETGELNELIRSGLARAPLSYGKFDKLKPIVSGKGEKASLLEALLAEREENR